MPKFSSFDDVIDSRDVIARIEELQSEKSLGEAEAEELQMLEKLADEASEYASDWEYGETLVRHSYWADYVQELCADCGYIPRDMPDWIEIDWKATARNVAQDYTTVELDGVKYYIRAC